MSEDTRRDDLRAVWQAQAEGTLHPSASELRARIERLVRTTRRRNYGALGACFIVLIGCFWWFAHLDNSLARIGALLTGVGIVTIVVQVRANQMDEQAAIRRAAEMGGTPSVDFYRRELASQRDFHRGRRLWTRLLLFVPGPLIFFVGFTQAHPEVAGTIRLEALAFALLSVAAVPANLWLARGYQRQLDALDS